MSRSFCISLSAALLLAVTPIEAAAQPKTVFSSGNIQVQSSDRQVLTDDGRIKVTSYQLLRDSINFGECYADPKLKSLPTTYYTAQGPLGVVMKKCNVKSGAAEPAIAVIGMNAGTVAVYARARQRFDFYEPSKVIVDLNERKGKDSYFPSIVDARQRGAELRIFHGSPREQLKKHGQKKSYKIIVLEACSGENGEKLFLEFFTKEGIAECLEHLTDDGVLCVHTSHRFLNLPIALAAMAKSLDLDVRRGHDSPPRDAARTAAEMAHFSSEWVMLARAKGVLDGICVTPKGYKPDPTRAEKEYWTTPLPCDQVWTDKGPNSVKGVLHSHPFGMRYQAAVKPYAEVVKSLATYVGQGDYIERHFWTMTRLPSVVDQWLVAQHLKNDRPLSQLWP